MFLALRDLLAARGRFALMGGTIVLVTILQVLLSGLAEGLKDDGVSGLRLLPAQAIAFQEGAEAVFSRSLVGNEDVDAVEAVVVGPATPLGLSFFNARTTAGTTVDLVLVGIDTHAFLRPDVDEGAPLGHLSEVVIDRRVADEGVQIGDTLTIVGPAEVEVTVVGVGPTGTYGHVPIAYTDLATWRTAQYGNPDTDVASAVAVQRSELSARPDLLDDPPGMEILSIEETFAGSPGFVPEQMTLGMIVAFLYVISALVVGAFFTVWTIQRTRDIGVLKALGAPTSYVLRDAVGQAVVLLAVSIGTGVAVGYGLGGVMQAGPAPFRLVPASILRGAALLTVFALLGAVVALRRITSVDPLVALGADR